MYCNVRVVSVRLQAADEHWAVAAVLSSNRVTFGPKGPLEVSSERLIQCASRGDLQAVSEILQKDLVHPDVADSQGNTALIAATVRHSFDRTNGARLLSLCRVCFLMLPVVFLSLR